MPLGHLPAFLHIQAILLPVSRQHVSFCPHQYERSQNAQDLPELLLQGPPDSHVSVSVFTDSQGTSDYLRLDYRSAPPASVLPPGSAMTAAMTAAYVGLKGCPFEELWKKGVANEKKGCNVSSITI